MEGGIFGFLLRMMKEHDARLTNACLAKPYSWEADVRREYFVVKWGVSPSWLWVYRWRPCLKLVLCDEHARLGPSSVVFGVIATVGLDSKSSGWKRAHKYNE
jgi:hypothetical protein